ncbi:hypothetical protein DSO57_1017456 [Entomophthora muscae]|uniref:Uncharacterized protein n=1 Tax=Entomophthora muscae TaxID=34485 RepID=A0ACC2RJ84_9FUNG|nr:hypothetical protein DSO57_1017456 [Entomophthora muscae]
MFKFAICLLGVVSGLKVVAIGDLHGDYDTALKTYRMADIVDEEGHWVGGNNLTVVQTGDVLDRGNDTIKLFKWIMQLQKEAEEAGGTLVQLLGNHEVMNLEEDYRYVTDQEIDSFGGKEARAEAFSRDGWLGQYLRSLNTTHQIGNTVFVHGGITSDWAGLGVDGINRESSNYLMNDSNKALKERKIFSSNEDSPLWFRGFSRDTDCDELSRALKALGANRMVMGHTVTSDKKIHAVCDGQGLLIDVGLSSFYGKGHASALELTQDTTQAIYPEKKIPLPHISGLEDQLRNSQTRVSIEDFNSEVAQELMSSNQGPYQEIIVEPIQESTYDSLTKPIQAAVIEPDQESIADSAQEYIIALIQNPGQEYISEASQESSQEVIIGSIKELGYGPSINSIQEFPQEIIIESMPESPNGSITELTQGSPEEVIIGSIPEPTSESITELMQDSPEEVIIGPTPEFIDESIKELSQDSPDEVIIGSIPEPTSESIKELMQDSPEEVIIGLTPDSINESIKELYQDSPEEVIIEPAQESSYKSILAPAQETIPDLGPGLKLVQV